MKLSSSIALMASGAALCLLVPAGCSDSAGEADTRAADHDGGVEAGQESGTTQDGSSSDGGEVVAGGCGSCHGTADQPAPPPGVGGDPTAPGVGAHAAHMADSTWRSPVRCTHCHVVPEHEDDEGHVDDQRPADVVFSGLAGVGCEPERLPDGSCAVYCHGAGMRTETFASPPWSSTGLSCGGCHQLPPPSPHPADDGCSRCHLEVIDEQGEIAHVSKHIDSVIQAPKGAHLVHLGGAGGPSLSCSTCHDGWNYHGPLKDGAFLDETTICVDCHEDGTVDKATWHDDMMGSPTSSAGDR